MIDPEYLRSLLKALSEAGYRGMANTDLWEKFVPGSEEGLEGEAAYKFKYHMDEICAIGLLRNSDTKEGCWGTLETDDGTTLVRSTLIISPLGTEVLEELEKPQGLDKLKEGIRAVGLQAGSGALQAAVQRLISG